MLRLRERCSFPAIGLALLFVAAIVGSSLNPPQHRAENKSRQESEIKADNRTADQRIADYTFWLFVFTGVLAGVAVFQLWIVWRGDRTTRIAADAAKTSADAASRQADSVVAIELPIFVIEDASILTSRSHGVEIKLGNHGRTPAIITADCLEIKAVDALPPKPRYSTDAILPIFRDRVVERGHTYSLIRKIPISDDEWTSVLNGGTVLWAYGYVDYLDFMMREHRLGYCIAFYPVRETVAEEMYPTMGFSSLRWGRTGSPAYTYNRYKTEAD